MKRSPLLSTILLSAVGVLSAVLGAEPALPIVAGAPVPLTESEDTADYWPCFSPDGSRLFFSRRFPGKPWQLYQIPVTGGAPTLLFDPSPSPAGTRIAKSMRGRLAFVGGNGIWITDSKGQQPRKLTLKGLPGTPSYPSWYPDEDHLLVVAYQKNNGGILYRINITSGEVAAVTDPSKILAGMASVSPDGKAIVFAGQRSDGSGYDQNRNTIWISRDGKEPAPLTHHQGRAPIWSPSGKWIAYESSDGSPDRRQAIFIASPDGKINQRITGFEQNPNHPVWSPDGKSLAVSIATPNQTGRTTIATISLDLTE